MKKLLIIALCFLIWTIVFVQVANAQTTWYEPGKDVNGKADSWTFGKRCDDCFVGPITLPFEFNMYGDLHDTLWMNSNGNLTFLSGSRSYNPTAFPNSFAKMIAPFYADSDFRKGPGRWGYYIDPKGTYAIFSWVQARHYFAGTSTKENNLQVLITNGKRKDLTGPGNNVCFNYLDMNWTSGVASGGTDGFGGIPAFVGLNLGDSLTGTEYGTFDRNGERFDGAGGLTEGVDHLDSTCFCFNAKLGTLPVVLTSYVAEVQSNGNVRLDWATSTEVNSHYFAIERAGPDMLFRELSQIPGSGNSIQPLTYKYVDSNPLNGKSYYRLRQVDFNGEFELFGTKSVNIDYGFQEFSFVKLVPNPATDLAEVTVTSDSYGLATIHIYSVTGQQVFGHDYKAQPGYNSYLLNLEELDSKSVYMMVIDKGGQTVTTKFLKK